jgi:signal transduction histidine kinase
MSSISEKDNAKLKRELSESCNAPDATAGARAQREMVLGNRIFRVSYDKIAQGAGSAAFDCVCVLADITMPKAAEHEIRRINDQLMAARDEAVQANRAKSAFLASMSHELRTPLNAIIGYTEMLQEEAQTREDAESLDDLSRIRYSAKHLLGMVTEILDLSKIEAGRTNLNLDSFDLRTLVEELVATVAPLAQQRGNEIQTCVEADAGSIWTDAAKLRQVLLNLLSNACKFTSGGSIDAKVSRHVEDAKDRVRFEISDTGIGIDPEKLATIFDAYQQAHDHESTEYVGTGLGLAISKQLAQLLGGSLSVSSTKGKGSVFTLIVLANMEDANSSTPETIGTGAAS